MSRRSRGCLRCRQRRVRCDGARPACQRCVSRVELCVGYRDDADLVFRDETPTVTVRHEHHHARRSRSVAASLRIDHGYLDGTTAHALPAGQGDDAVKDEAAAASFMDRYVIRPCTESSVPGFLEHLPTLFNEVNVRGRCALRWAVLAAGFADMAGGGGGADSATRAIECYGRSLADLGRSLSERGKAPDDCDLMTMVVLDVFESLFLPDETQRGTHAQAMAHVLRLRGHSQFHDPRGWGLFRLAHHRLQKEQLAKRLAPASESQRWMAGIDVDAVPFSQVERTSMDISAVCHRARTLQTRLGEGDCAVDELVELIREMRAVDRAAARWRQKPSWSFRTLARGDITEDTGVLERLPEFVEVHRDVWMAYEWNYHRTARIILHQQVIESLESRQQLTGSHQRSTDDDFVSWTETSMRTIELLGRQVLSTVPQSLGEIDPLGVLVDGGREPSRYQAVGAYLLLWPVKVIMDPRGRSPESQRSVARSVYERIRSATGMKSCLGGLSAHI